MKILQYFSLVMITNYFLLSGCESNQSKLINKCLSGSQETGIILLPVHTDTFDTCQVNDETIKISNALIRKIGSNKVEYRALMDELKRVCSGASKIDEPVPEIYCTVFK